MKKNCFDCKAELPADAEFCHKCGVSVAGQAVRAVASRKPRPAQSSELRAKGVADYVAIQARILTEARAKTKRAAAFFVVSSVILTLVILDTPGLLNIGHLAAGFAIMAITSNLIGRVRGLTTGEYYSITGSRNPEGEHRCIFCGNPGIYTQGEYAGNTKYAQCSKCKEPLFSH